MQKRLGIFVCAPDISSFMPEVPIQVTSFENLGTLPICNGGVRPFPLGGKLYCTGGWQSNKFYEYTETGFNYVNEVAGLKDQSMGVYGDAVYTAGNGRAYKIQNTNGEVTFTLIGSTTSNIFNNHYNGSTFIVDGILGYGGGVIGGSYATAQHSIFLYHEETDTWEKRENALRGNRPSAGVFAQGSKLYSFNIHSQVGSSVEIYDIHTEEKTSIPVPCSNVTTTYYTHRGFVYRGIFYIFLDNRYWSFNLRTYEQTEGDYGINNTVGYKIGYSRFVVFEDKYIYAVVGPSSARNLLRMPI